MDESFAGRARELAALDDMLCRSAAGAGEIARIAGGAGTGKTALIRRFLSRNRPAVRWASGGEDERWLPGGLLAQLGVHGVPDDPLRAGSGLLESITGWRGVLVIDDAQWGDELSLRALGYALRRLHTEPVLAVVAVRDDEPRRLPSCLDRVLRDGAETLAMRGFEAAEVAHFTERIFAVSLPPRACKRLVDHTGGIPLQVREVLHALPRETLRAVLTDPDAPLPVPKSVAARVAAALAGCSPAARDLVGAAAVLGVRCRLADAAAVAALAAPPLGALQEAVRAGLLAESETVDGLCCEFEHASVRSAVYRDIGAVRRAALHAEAAGLTTGTAALAHRVAGCPGTDDALAGDLAAQARTEASAGELGGAAGHYLAAARVTRRGAHHDGLVRAAAHLLVTAGDAVRARGLAGEVTAMPPSRERSLLLARLAAADGDPDAARRRLTEAWPGSARWPSSGAWPTCAAWPSSVGWAASAAWPGSVGWAGGERPARSASVEAGPASALGGRPGGAERPADSATAAEAACELAELLLARRQRAEAARWAWLAASRAPGGLPEAWARVLLAVGLAMEGRSGTALAVLRAAVAAEPAGAAGQLLRGGFGMISLWCDDLPGAARHLAAAAGEAGQAGRGNGAGAPVPGLPPRLRLEYGVLLAQAHYRLGEWDAAAARAAEIIAAAQDLDQGWLLASAHAAAVYPAAGRGDWAAARAHLDAAARQLAGGDGARPLAPSGAALLRAAGDGGLRDDGARLAAEGDSGRLLEFVNARAALAFARDDTEGVLAAVRPAADVLTDYAAEPALLGCWPLYAQALARTGRPAEAAEVIAPFTELALANGRCSAIAAAFRVRGLIQVARNRPDAARTAFHEAVRAVAGFASPHEEALARLDLGRFLRRAGQRRAAMRELCAARAAFAALGAAPFVGRCDAELGEHAPGLRGPGLSGPHESDRPRAARSAMGAPPLTERQLAVARAVVAGKSNQQIARDLYITVKTVEYHVSQILTRLGVDARTEIAAALGDQ